jgi:hypothetical protein
MNKFNIQTASLIYDIKSVRWYLIKVKLQEQSHRTIKILMVKNF